MPQVTRLTCEVQIDGDWRAVSLADARARYGDARKRCPACHGQIAVAGTYSGAGTLVLQHRRAHTGCPLLSRRYCGTPSLHPQAIA